MNDEIKEILYYWEKYHFEDCMIDSKECKILYDYITNLQEELEEEKRIEEADLKTIQRLEEENERLKEQVNENKVIVEYAIKPSFTTRKLKELKQENERLKEIWKDTNVIVKDDKTLVMNTNAYDTLEDYKSRCEKASERIKQIQLNAIKYGANHDAIICQDLLNILQNGSDDNE